MRFLVADCGSTKAAWTYFDDGRRINVTTEGFNPAIAPVEEVSSVLSGQLMPQLDGAAPERVWFYGAGCIGGEVNARLGELLAGHIPGAAVEVESDLLGAARALLGNRRGIAAILGTGSNTGLYNGSAIERNIPSLGFILGDEGSGSALGKRLLNAMFKASPAIPEDLRRAFFSSYPLSQAEVIRRVYRSSAPNRFLASFAPFLSEHIHKEEIAALVGEEMALFVERNLLPYNAPELPMGFVGSVAWHFAPQLTGAMTAAGLPEPTAIMGAPLDALVEYHAKTFLPL